MMTTCSTDKVNYVHATTSFPRVWFFAVVFFLTSAQHIYAQLLTRLGVDDYDLVTLAVSVMIFILFVLLWLSFERPSRTVLPIFFIIIFQAIWGILNEAKISYSLATLSSQFIAVYIVFSTFRQNEIYLGKLLYLSTAFFAYASIAVDILNFFVKGHGWIVTLLNNYPIFVLMATALIIFGDNSLKIKSKKLLIITALYLVLGIFRDFDIARLQYKSIIFLLLIVIGVIAIYLAGAWLRKSQIKRPVSSIIIIMLVLVSFAAITFVRIGGYYIELTARNYSYLVRQTVAMKMMDETTSTWYTVLIGKGSGTSQKRFDISEVTGPIGGEDQDASTHSGILNLFYEGGIISLIMWFFLLIWPARRQKKIYASAHIDSKYIYQIYRGPLSRVFFFYVFIILFWVMINMVLPTAFPGPEIFFQSQLSTFFLLITFIASIIRRKSLEVAPSAFLSKSC